MQGDWLGQPDAFDEALARRLGEVTNLRFRSVLTARPRAVLEADYGIPRRYLNGIMSPWAVKRLEEFGGDLSRATLAASIVKVGGAVQPIINLLRDHLLEADLIHAALFRGPHVHHLRARFAGNRLEDALTSMGVLPRLLTEACEGTLTPHIFARLWRRRLRNLPFLKELLARTEAAQSQRRLWVLCRALNTRVNLPRARRLYGRLHAHYATPAERADAGAWAED